MVQGTASSAGKSTLVAGLCRLFARRGVRVAPFKAQNMSNNAAVCRDGEEIGRAQYAQAVAACIEPTVDMNPVLLKPQPDGCQVVVHGRACGVATAEQYFGGRSLDLWPSVTQSLDRLRASYELVIAEGAGSPAEINLRSRDIVNMRVALYAQAVVLVVADIDRGGAFASLLGTWSFLEPAERALVRGFVLNKFRGDPGLLEPAPSLLHERTGVPVVGVVPFVDDLQLPDEDAASLLDRRPYSAEVEIAVVRLPHIANFDEFTPLAGEHAVHVRYVTSADELRAPDLLILPGTKATIPDLLWLRERGLADRITWLAAHDTPVLGVCGGYQMLGRRVSDPLHVESRVACAEGLGLLPISTELLASKRLARVHGTVAANGPGVWSALSGLPFEGYEIHNGATTGATRESAELAVGADGVVAGTYVHGLLESAAVRDALVHALAARRGFDWRPERADTDPYDRIAHVLEVSLDLSWARSVRSDG
ncbi:MAG: cobyric acid synthase [Chloroflexi bacterium]|nr:cobyric acid synthase [Chloroflexota bacterium]